MFTKDNFFVFQKMILVIELINNLLFQKIVAKIVVKKFILIDHVVLIVIMIQKKFILMKTKLKYH